MRRTSKRTAASRKRSLARPAPTSSRELSPALVAFREVARAQNLRWYLFGAQAVAAYGVPRTTTDIDITIELGTRSLGEIARALATAGFRATISDPAFVYETRIFPVTHEPSGWKIDLVLAGPGLEEVFLERVHHRRIGRHEFPVISPEDLVVLKVLASRPKDLEDVRGLLRIAKLDHRKVEQTLRDLEQALDQSDLRPAYARLRAEIRPPPRRRAKR